MNVGMNFEMRLAFGLRSGVTINICTAPARQRKVAKWSWRSGRICSRGNITWNKKSWVGDSKLDKHVSLIKRQPHASVTRRMVLNSADIPRLPKTLPGSEPVGSMSQVSPCRVSPSM